MKFIKAEKRLAGHFVTAFDLHYETAAGREKVYEMAARQQEIKDCRDLWDHRAEAVLLMLSDADDQHLLLLKEFRMAAGEPVWNFPAGLVEPDEDPATAARRELKEETGLELLSIDAVLPAAYNAVGISNEKNIALRGRAGGQFAPSTSDEEEIEARWLDREQLRVLLEKEPFEARTQLFCWFWLQGRDVK